MMSALCENAGCFFFCLAEKKPQIDHTRCSFLKRKIHANEKVLPVAAIFGANASGKSNVQEAFRYMSAYVINSLDYGNESDSKKNSRFFKPTPFLFEMV